MHAADLMMAAQ